ncbi:Uu.00g096490.m01.CDS01 [Anthostomella pinea]|uniref:Uu.00g096490.m01.CDS01 n=1 Tax=Anthostomella pinea TaxID=933095 RepID=A0AAI8VD80_9PEZI|nr:Uu.00g096490.m01.CDS01 [Anthostomella pinea]
MKLTLSWTIIASLLAASTTAGLVPVRSHDPNPIHIYQTSIHQSITQNQAAPRDSEKYKTFQKRAAALPKHRHGYMHMADDGVFRSLGPFHEVLGFVEEAAETPELRDHLRAVWDGVDGREVADPSKIRPEHIFPALREGLVPRNGVSRPDDILERDGGVQKLEGRVRFCLHLGKECGKNDDCGRPEACDCERPDNQAKGKCKQRL